ncbi:MAG: ATP-dependent helicase RecG [Acidobacteriota bacterium]|jgi:predicted HTH transcriptional regulator|nr:ATP-dependent helicase RecG [Acidobacteriota bacterium]MDT7809452.1 ATP-dependent helicase RecG [Acidobacteriota bacterium]
MTLVRGGEDTFLELKVKLSNPERIAQGIVALANTGGGVIVFGVNDNLRVEGLDDPESVRDELVRICREDVSPALFPFIDIISFDNGLRVVALDVEGKRRPYRTADGRYFLRVGAEKREATREELSALLDESRPLTYENVVALGAEVEDVDEAHLWSFVREFEPDAYAPSRSSVAAYPTAEVLERDLLLAVAAASGARAERVAPTVAGLLLFGRDERVAELLPRATITAARFAGHNTQAPKVESVELKGNLHTLFESAVRFVERYCDLWEKRPRTTQAVDVAESPVVPRANYHRGAMLEALANALVHRDLALAGAATRLLIFDNSVEVTNPRRTVGFAPAMQRAIRYGIPQRLNPQTAAVFTSAAYGLRLSTGGLPMLLRESRLFSGRKTEIHAVNDEFRVRLYGV